MSLQQKKFLAEDARQLLENKLLQGAFNAIGDYLETQAITCDPDNKDKTQRIIVAKQILAGVKREITRYIEDGAIADIQMRELEKKQFRFFSR